MYTCPSEIHGAVYLILNLVIHRASAMTMNELCLIVDYLNKKKSGNERRRVKNG
jgi:hypothetical protein